MEIKYKRTLLTEFKPLYIPDYAYHTPVSIDMRVVINDSFGLVYCKDIPACLRRKKKQVGAKLVKYACFYNFITGEKLVQINYPKDYERFSRDSADINQEDAPKRKTAYKYLVKDSLFSPVWKFLDQKKIILNKTCFAALSIDQDNDSILVWYSKELPFQKGPLWYDNLPGITMEIFDQKRNAHIVATKIDEREMTIVPPQNGTTIPHTEWMKIYKTIPIMKPSITFSYHSL